MIIDMVEEVYKDISADDQGGAPADPLADPLAEEMRKALEDSHKKIEALTEKIDKLAETGFSIDNENKEPEDGTEKAKESEKLENEDQNT